METQKDEIFEQIVEDSKKNLEDLQQFKKDLAHRKKFGEDSMVESDAMMENLRRITRASKSSNKAKNKG